METVCAPNGTHEFVVFANLVLVVRDNTVILTLAPEDYHIIYAAELEAALQRVAS